ncbi:MAG: glycosyltransferase family 4 protein [Verrucomicrobiae bacterium]
MDAIVEREWIIGLLAAALDKSGFLNRVYGGFPAFRYKRLGISPDRLRTYPFASVWNQLARKLKLPGSLRLCEPLSVANWVARHKDLAPVINCNGTAYRFLFPRLQNRSHTLVIERGSMYPEDYFLFQERAKREAGFPSTDRLPESILDEMEKTKLADFVLCGSEMTRDSYLQRGLPPDRVITCHYGIDEKRFQFAERKSNFGRSLRLVTVGSIGLRKGIWRLIQFGEWAIRRGLDLEIWLVGPLDPEAVALLGKTPAKFRTFGVLKGSAFVETLQQADAYAMFSYEEGFPLSLISAMSTGLPALTSNDTGGREAVTPGLDGLVLNNFSHEEFDALLPEIFQDKKRLIQMGRNARLKVDANFTLDHYTRKIQAAYILISDFHHNRSSKNQTK